MTDEKVAQQGCVRFALISAEPTNLELAVMSELLELFDRLVKNPELAYFLTDKVVNFENHPDGKVPSPGLQTVICSLQRLLYGFLCDEEGKPIPHRLADLRTNGWRITGLDRGRPADVKFLIHLPTGTTVEL